MMIIKLLNIFKYIYLYSFISVLSILLFPFQYFYFLDNFLILRYLLCFLMDNWFDLSNKCIYNIILFSYYLTLLIIVGNLFTIVCNFWFVHKNINLSSLFVCYIYNSLLLLLLLLFPF